MKKHKFWTLSRKRAMVGLLFISPWLVGFLLFYLRSLIMTFNFSISKETLLEQGGYSLTKVGLANFKYIFTEHANFNLVFTSSMMDMVIDVPLIIFFSIFMALLLNKKFKGRTLVRAIFFLPVILNSEAIQSAIQYASQIMGAGLSQASADAETAAAGGVNLEYYLDLFKDLAMPDAILDYIVAAVDRLSSIITASGVQIVIFIAALQSIPPSMYEVAKIEGATGYETFWKVTLPMIMPHIITNIVYTVVDKFSQSGVLELAYETTIHQQNYGVGSAMSLVSMLAVCLLLFVVCAYISKRTFYYN